MKRVLAIIALMCVPLFFLANASSSAEGGNGPIIPIECQAAVDSGRFEAVFAQPGVPTNGGSGNQVIIGTPGDDVIDGGSGSDVICGGGGNDTISGGSGSDQIFGSEGDDTLFGNSGGDLLDGGPGAAVCDGGTGSNTLVSCNDGDPNEPDTDTPSMVLSYNVLLADANGSCAIALYVGNAVSNTNVNISITFGAGDSTTTVPTTLTTDTNGEASGTLPAPQPVVGDSVTNASASTSAMTATVEPGQMTCYPAP